MFGLPCILVAGLVGMVGLWLGSAARGFVDDAEMQQLREELDQLNSANHLQIGAIHADADAKAARAFSNTQPTGPAPLEGDRRPEN